MEFLLVENRFIPGINRRVVIQVGNQVRTRHHWFRLEHFLEVNKIIHQRPLDHSYDNRTTL
ncbi:hypothetical protein [Spirosoma terrae]|uniref:Uncharacterized protein n=1 Tax=Spirosoma terrae TaxID=1968276 RepID=A0A6L9LBD9_9BACT|nr:hypothetical protein [Spirosoma terrae]NDU95778.1 hypothetical protein [Spirosoma terrae]